MSAGARTSVLLSTPQILVLDDDAGVRRSAQLLLRGRGFEVRSFARAEPLLDDAKSREADCLVTDYLLDQLDGIEVFVRLRETGWTGAGLLVTAFGTADLVLRASAAGFSDVLDKPLKAHTFLLAVSRAVAQARSGGGGRGGGG